jgi:hypothetical protein
VNDNIARGGDTRGRAVLGALLVLAGIVFMLDQFFPIDLGRQGWPLFVIVPGVFLCVFAVALRGSGGEALFIVGTVVSMVGLVLAYQNYTNHWESWAYAWALVGPFAIGLGQMVYGLLTGRGAAVRAGMRVAAVGLVLFVVFGAFFESAIGISGRQISWLTSYLFPVLLIGLGVMMLLGNFWRREQSPAPRTPATMPREEITTTDLRQTEETPKGLE